MRLPGLIVALALGIGLGCRDEAVRKRRLSLGADVVAEVTERIVREGDELAVQRTVNRPGAAPSTLSARVAADGTLVSARYQRGARVVEAGPLWVQEAERAGNEAVRRTATRPLVSIDLLHLARGAAALPAGATVTLVDLASAELLSARLSRRGAELVAVDDAGVVVARVNAEGVRTGPGAFVEGEGTVSTVGAQPLSPSLPGSTTALPLSVRLMGLPALAGLALDGPGQEGGVSDGTVTIRRGAFGAKDPPTAEHRSAEPFIESSAAAVRAFAGPTTTGSSSLAAATALATKVHALVDAEKTEVPPSALDMLAEGGDCDGAAALVTAALRAQGHAARTVVGYKLIDGRLVPHAWAEVFADDGWQMVDATLPGVGVFPTHLKLFYGTGGALTLGRVLGVVSPEPSP